MQMLQALFDAARIHGTEVRLTPVAVPAYWAGPVFTRDPELATLRVAREQSDTVLLTALQHGWSVAGLAGIADRRGSRTDDGRTAL
ncbi:hypothetical protein ACFWWT_41820 [Streptomyces sp. NPDC058676]|uniref:hypothetical protein n=1 Tax=unclassified Streptomyces TaxID=2593676 RepID=UPI00364A3801